MSHSRKESTLRSRCTEANLQYQADFRDLRACRHGVVQIPPIPKKCQTDARPVPLFQSIWTAPSVHREGFSSEIERRCRRLCSRGTPTRSWVFQSDR